MALFERALPLAGHSVHARSNRRVVLPLATVGWGGTKPKQNKTKQDYHGIKLPKLRDWCRNERLDESGTLDDLRYRHQK